MKGFKKVIILVLTMALLSAPLNLIMAQTQNENESFKTFFDSWVPEIKLQVNATAETKPTQNITVVLSLMGHGEVFINHLNFSVYGFLRGERKILLNSISDRSFKLNTRQYSSTFKVPENFWGVAYGEIILDYTVKYAVGQGMLTMPYNITVGFSMTGIENVYLKSLEEQNNFLKEQINSLEDQLRDVYSAIDELNQTFRDCFGRNLTRDELLNLNQTIWELQRDYEVLKGVKSELDNTRTAMVFLAVVAVFFVATTAYLVFRKPKGYL